MLWIVQIPLMVLGAVTLLYVIVALLLPKSNYELWNEWVRAHQEPKRKRFGLF